MISIFVIVMAIIYITFYKKGKAARIVKIKPKFFNNHKLSVIITITFFLITTSFLFWGPIFLKNILK
jgi:hypothetical protein